jgi:hypothetical protein
MQYPEDDTRRQKPDLRLKDASKKELLSRPYQKNQQNQLMDTDGTKKRQHFFFQERMNG